MARASLRRCKCHKLLFIIPLLLVSLNLLFIISAHLYLQKPEYDVGDYLITLNSPKKENEKEDLIKRKQTTPSVAFLFLTSGETNDDLWRRWFPPRDDRYSIFVHTQPSENTIPLGPFLCPYAIPSVKTGWCELHNAMMQLLQHAYYHDLSAEYFMFVSDTSIPVLSFDELYENFIEDRGKSRFCWTTDDTPRYHFQNYAQSFGLDLDRVGKSEMWISLSRNHAKLVLKHRSTLDYWNAQMTLAQGRGCYDEMLIPTALRQQLNMSEFQRCSPSGPSHLNTCCTHAVFWRDTALTYDTVNKTANKLMTDLKLLRSIVTDKCTRTTPCFVESAIKEEGMEALRDNGYLMFRKISPNAEIISKTGEQLPMIDALLQFVARKPLHAEPKKEQSVNPSSFQCKAPKTLL